MYDLMFGGYGARACRDGAEALSPVVNCAQYPGRGARDDQSGIDPPLRAHPDTGGAGRWRGGCGVRKDIELRAERADVTLLGERHTHRGYGLCGGRPGSLAETVLNPEGEALRLGSKEVPRVAAGETSSASDSMAAAVYGDPRDRDPAAVANDVADGYVTPAAASKIYGWRE